MPRLLLIAAASLAPLVAQAQETSSRPTGLYLRGGAGVGFADDLDQSIAFNPNPPIISMTSPPNASATKFGRGLSISAAIGFQYARTRTELEYRRITPDYDSITLTGGFDPSATPPDAPQVLTPGAGGIARRARVQALMSNVYFDFANSSRLTPYIGVGVGGARVENHYRERDAAFAFQGRAGLEFAISDSLSAGAEYVYFRTMELVYGPKEFTPYEFPLTRTDGDAFVSSSVMGTLRVLF